MDSSMKTPKRNVGCAENPFSNGIFHGLHLTPSIFKMQSTPSDHSPQSFRWSIEQQAFMNPIDIDNSKALEQSSRLLAEVENPQVQRLAREHFESFEYTTNRLLCSPADASTLFGAKPAFLRTATVGTQTDWTLPPAAVAETRARRSSCPP
ncbi:hypothetical protein M3Y99_01580300 [Aphelenchoides fujianensis]|nr:hypothetical protein M3Y99_01580300 [Aphelenchoides fujianensis]